MHYTGTEELEKSWHAKVQHQKEDDRRLVGMYYIDKILIGYMLRNV